MFNLEHKKRTFFEKDGKRSCERTPDRTTPCGIRCPFQIRKAFWDRSSICRAWSRNAIFPILSCWAGGGNEPISSKVAPRSSQEKFLRGHSHVVFDAESESGVRFWIGALFSEPRPIKGRFPILSSLNRKEESPLSSKEGIRSFQKVWEWAYSHVKFPALSKSEVRFQIWSAVSPPGGRERRRMT